MDAKKLHAIVEKVPREAWPPYIVFDRGVFWIGYGDSDDYDLSDAHAELLFIGSMVRWLLRLPDNPPIRACLMLSQLSEGYMVDTGRLGLDEWHGYSKSVVEALAAACIAAGKEQQ